MKVSRCAVVRVRLLPVFYASLKKQKSFEKSLNKKKKKKHQHDLLLFM